MNKIEPAVFVEEYNTGQYSVADMAKIHGISTGKMYYLLHDAGCVFSRKWRKPMPEEARRKIGERNRGKTITEEQRRIISERNSCNYNGLNGYGHTKKHCRGYVLAYVPKHPNAHKDGYVMLHTVMIERLIGRYLKSDEVVHHINHQRDDNRIENLVLMNKHEHFSMHMRERYMKKRGNDLLTAL